MSATEIAFAMIAGAFAVTGLYLTLTPTALLMRGAPDNFQPHPLDRRLPGWRRAMGLMPLIAGAALAYAVYAGWLVL